MKKKKKDVYFLNKHINIMSVLRSSYQYRVQICMTLTRMNGFFDKKKKNLQYVSNCGRLGVISLWSIKKSDPFINRSLRGRLFFFFLKEIIAKKKKKYINKNQLTCYSSVTYSSFFSHNLLYNHFIQSYSGHFQKLLPCFLVRNSLKLSMYNSEVLLLNSSKVRNLLACSLKLTLETSKTKETQLIPIEYTLQSFHRSNQDTCLVHRPSVLEGEWVQSGDLLADSSASVGGELSLGQNILIAYMPWEGFNYEDAILISERLVYDEVYTSVHIERYETEIRETIYGKEKITKEIPDVSEKEIQHLDSKGISYIGTWVEEGDILVGKIAPINKKSQSSYQKLIYTILDKEFIPFRDSSLRAPKGMKAKVVNVHIAGPSFMQSEKIESKTKRLDASSLNEPIITNAFQFSQKRDFTHKEKKFLIIQKSSKNHNLPWFFSRSIKSIRNSLISQTFFEKVDIFNEMTELSKARSKKVFYSNPTYDTKNTFPILSNFKKTKKFETSLNDKAYEEKKNIIKSWSPMKKFSYGQFFQSFRQMRERDKNINYDLIIDFKNCVLSNFTKTDQSKIKKPFSVLLINLYKKSARKDKFHLNTTSIQYPINGVLPHFYRQAVQSSLELDIDNKILHCLIRNGNNKKELFDDIGLKKVLLQKKKESVVTKTDIQVESDMSFIQIYLAEKRKIQIGDKMAGRHGNKGIVSQILPRQDMPYLPDGTPVDMVLNPLGVPSRMNVGQIYECLLGLAGKYLGINFRIFPFDEIYGAEASRSFVYSKLFEAKKKTQNDWLFNPNFPGKTRLFDGRCGDCFDQPVTVGQSYMLKLVHLVDDKIHCLTKDHEVLTTNGWVPIAQIQKSHRIATLKKNGKLVYDYPSKIFHYKNYKGSLYHIKNLQIDLLVTPEHRMCVSRPFANKNTVQEDLYQLIPAKDIMGYPHKYLTKGPSQKSYYKGIKSIINFQEKKVHTNIYLNLIRTTQILPFTNFQLSGLCLDNVQSTLLNVKTSKLIKTQPKIPTSISSSLVTSNSSKFKRKSVLQVINHRFANTSMIDKNLLYNHTEEILDYNGDLYCLKVPNEVFYVRRKGKPVWTGNSRSAGPYSLVTQQPLRGRSKQGGQRLGEMEVWAFEGYGAVFVLLELLTIKSDNISGRLTLWSNLILNRKISIGTPESFKVLVSELQALCIDIDLFS